MTAANVANHKEATVDLLPADLHLVVARDLRSESC
jgi:hypothetical protein